MTLLKKTYDELNRKTKNIANELKQIRTEIKVLEKTEKILKEQLTNLNAVIYAIEDRNPDIAKLVDEPKPAEQHDGDKAGT